MGTVRSCFLKFRQLEAKALPALIVSIQPCRYMLSTIRRPSMTRILIKWPTFRQQTWPLLQPFSRRHPTSQKPLTWTKRGQMAWLVIQIRTSWNSSRVRRYFNKIRERTQNSAGITVDTPLWVEEARMWMKETWTSSSSTLKCNGSPHPQSAKVNRIAYHIMTPGDSRPKYSTIASCCQTIIGHGQRPVVDATTKAYAIQARSKRSRLKASSIQLSLTCTWTIPRKNQLRHLRCTQARS